MTGVNPNTRTYLSMLRELTTFSSFAVQRVTSLLSFKLVTELKAKLSYLLLLYNNIYSIVTLTGPLCSFFCFFLLSRMTNHKDPFLEYNQENDTVCYMKRISVSSTSNEDDNCFHWFNRCFVYLFLNCSKLEVEARFFSIQNHCSIIC